MLKFLFPAAAALLLPIPVVAQTPPPAKAEILLPKDTPVKIVLAYGISAKAAKIDDMVYMRVFEAVAHQGRTIIPEGASVQGRVTRAVAPGGGGRPGVLEIDAEFVVTEDARYRVTGAISTAGLDQTPSGSTGLGNAAGGSLTVPLGGRKAGNANLSAGDGFVARVARDY
jgi:hypothetical protein